MGSLCHVCATATHLSYRFFIFETSATALCGTTGNRKSSTDLWFSWFSVAILNYPIRLALLSSHLSGKLHIAHQLWCTPLLSAEVLADLLFAQCTTAINIRHLENPQNFWRFMGDSQKNYIKPNILGDLMVFPAIYCNAGFYHIILKCWSWNSHFNNLLLSNEPAGLSGCQGTSSRNS